MKKNEQKEKKKTKPVVRVIKWVLFLLLFCIVTAGIYVGVKLYGIKKAAKALVEEGGNEIFRQGLTTIIYDGNGNILTSLSSEKDAYYLEFENIPYMVKEIFLVTEDRDFYEHSGVNYKSVVRALTELIKNDGEITQGGSTITQQLARNTYLSHEVTLNRKLKEVFIAWKLEELYSKDDILEYYINNIYFANGLYGVEAAAKGYFGKKAGELTLSQLCYICAIPNNPELYNPFENSDNTVKRRNRILKQLKEQKIINGKEYEEAIAETVVLAPDKKIKNNYVDTFVKYSATRELMKYRGFKFQYYFNSKEEKESYLEKYNDMYSQCNSLLFTGGYRIYTSIDVEKQKLLQETLDNQLSSDMETNEEGIYRLQGSAVTIDNDSGYVVAAVGGREQDYNGYTLNRAYQSFRQPGSSIKPILIYTPLFERGFTPDSIVVDEKIQGGPVNSPNVYGGQMTVRTALALSKNTVAWKMFDKIGTSTAINYLLNMQFSHIVREDYVPAMSIGGMTYGVSALEMASAFAAIENQGIYRTPTCIVKITDSQGMTLIDNGKHRTEGKTVYEKNAAAMTTDVLKDVLNWGTGAGYKIESAVCAGKTGTTNDNKDCWFAGYSRYYTTAVWCGYDIPKTLEGETIRSAGVIWKKYMEEIHKGLEKKEFPLYEKYGTEENEVETTAAPEETRESDEEITGETGEETGEHTVEETEKEGESSVYSETGENENTEYETGEYVTNEAETDEAETDETGTVYIPVPNPDDGLYIENMNF